MYRGKQKCRTNREFTSQSIRHNEQETVWNFVKDFCNKKEQTSEFFFQICSQFSWKSKNVRSSPVSGLKRQNVIYGFTLKIFSSRYAKKSEKSDFFGLSSILYNRDGADNRSWTCTELPRLAPEGSVTLVELISNTFIVFTKIYSDYFHHCSNKFWIGKWKSFIYIGRFKHFMFGV